MVMIVAHFFFWMKRMESGYGIRVIIILWFLWNLRFVVSNLDVLDGIGGCWNWIDTDVLFKNLDFKWK